MKYENLSTDSNDDLTRDEGNVVVKKGTYWSILTLVFASGLLIGYFVAEISRPSRTATPVVGAITSTSDISSRWNFKI